MRGPIDHLYEGALIDAETDKVLVLGYELLYELAENPDSPCSRAVLAFLDKNLDDPDKRALFGFPPLLDYDDTLKPFKPRR